MILAAGYGKRMGSLTIDLPKPLLLLRGQPLISYHLRAMARAGIQEVVINLGYLGHKIEEALGQGEQFNVRIHYSYEEPILETGGGIVYALPLLGEAPFMVVSADIFTDFPFEQLPKFPKGLAHLVMVDNPSHHPTGDYGLVGEAVMESGGPLLNFSGIGVYRPELFVDCPKGAFPIALLFKKAIQSHAVTGEYYAGLWHNIGTPLQLSELNDSTSYF